MGKIKGLIKCSVCLICTLLLTPFSCKKEKSEALEIRPVNNKTILKNHTSGVDYFVQDLEVNAELIIEAGVQINVNKGGKITVGPSGKLVIMGTKKDKVIIKGKGDQAWAGIIFSSSIGSLKGFELINASSSTGSILILGKSEVSAEQVEVRESVNSNSFVVNGESVLRIKKGCIVSHAHIPFQKDLNAKIQFDAQVEMNQIGIECILLQSSHDDDISLDRDQTLAREDIPYLCAGDLRVNEHRLVITSGTTLLMGIGKSIRVHKRGELYLDGKATSPVVLSCVNANRNWNGIVVSNAKTKLYRTQIYRVSNTNLQKGVVTVGWMGEADIQYTNFATNQVQCAIVLEQSGRLNASAYSLNQFGPLNPICIF